MKGTWIGVPAASICRRPSIECPLTNVLSAVDSHGPFHLVSQQAAAQQRAERAVQRDELLGILGKQEYSVRAAGQLAQRFEVDLIREADREDLDRPRRSRDRSHAGASCGRRSDHRTPSPRRR